MSHTIVRETSNEAGEKKILRGKSLNSGAGIFNGQSLNSVRKNLLLGASGWWEAENKTQEEEKIERVTEMGCDNVSFGLVRLLGWWVNMRAARKKKGGRGGSERGARAGGASPSGWWRRFEAPESQSGKSVQDGWSASRFYRSSFLYVTHCAYALISLRHKNHLVTVREHRG